MANRTKRQQSKHDQAVEKTADYYRKLNFKVQADIQGFEKPDLINRKRPDVIAKKGKETILVEVETKDSIKTDQTQIKTFQNYADSRKNVRFRTKLAK